MKKRRNVLFCFLLMLSCLGCGQSKEKDNGIKENVTIELIVMNESETLFDGEISATGSTMTLEDVLLANAETLQLISENDAYGMKIIGLMGIETSNWSKGPWWMFESTNNASCVEAGYCLGASDVPVATGDQFVFEFSSGY